MIISSKAGWDMWPGPYGIGGSRKYLVASLDQSLKRMGLDYVDIFYSHRPTPDVPLEETMARSPTSCVRARRSMSASRPTPERTREARASSRTKACRCSSTNRPIPCSTVGSRTGFSTRSPISASAASLFQRSPRASHNKYLNGVPADARAAKEGSFKSTVLSADNLARVRALDGFAQNRGQSLAQMAIAWVLRDPRVTSALIGAHSVAQLDDSLKALDNLAFTVEELAAIDQHATEGGVDLWRSQSRLL